MISFIIASYFNARTSFLLIVKILSNRSTLPLAAAPSAPIARTTNSVFFVFGDWPIVASRCPVCVCVCVCVCSIDKTLIDIDR